MLFLNVKGSGIQTGVEHGSKHKKLSMRIYKRAYCKLLSDTRDSISSDKPRIFLNETKHRRDNCVCKGKWYL